MLEQLREFVYMFVRITIVLRFVSLLKEVVYIYTLDY